VGWRDEDLALLASSISRALDRQRDNVNQLRSVAVRGSPAACLATRLSAVYVAVERQAQEIRELDADGDDELLDGARVALRTVLESARDLQRTTDWLHAAEREPIDLGTRYFVDACAQDLLPIEMPVLVVPRAEYIYAVIPDPLKLADTAADGPQPSVSLSRLSSAREPDGPAAEPSIERSPLVVFVPELERRTTLLHPLIVHELAHPLVQKEELWLAPLDAVRERSDNSTIVEAEGHLDADKMRGLGMVQAWLTEAACDAVALHYMGPSFVMAFMAAAVSASDPAGAFPTHPPLVTRLRIMVDQCDALGWERLSLPNAPHIEDLVRQLAEIRPEVDDQYATLDNMVRNLGPRLAEVVRDHLGARILSPQRFADESPAIRNLLEKRVPPAHDARGAAFDRRSVILASWHDVLAAKRGGDLSTALVDEEADARLARSLQMIAVVEAWATAGEGV
jgi:hypothetical protein